MAHALPAYIEGFDVELDPEVNGLKTERYHIRLGDACAMDYPDSVFDAVFYHHVIEHVPDPQRSIAECARVLRAGGYLYCGTPNRTRLMGYIGARATRIATSRADIARNRRSFQPSEPIGRRSVPCRESAIYWECIRQCDGS